MEHLLGALLRQKDRLAEQLGRFLTFDSFNLYFPPFPLDAPEILASEKVLIAPLLKNGHFLGAARIGGISVEEAENIMLFLPAILELCVDNACLAEEKVGDRETGLLWERSFLEQLGQYVDYSAARKLNVIVGALVLKWPAGVWFERRYPEECKRMWGNVARGICEILPDYAVAGILGWEEGKYEIGVFLPVSGRGVLHRLATRLVTELSQEIHSDYAVAPAGGNRLVAGHALYPQDFRGAELHEAPSGRARLLRNRARLAAESLMVANLSRSALAYAWIAAQTGRILEIIDYDRVRINLGKNIGIEKGDRFFVLSAGQRNTALASKAQLKIQDIYEEEAVGLLVHHDQPGSMLEVGDAIIPAVRVKSQGDSLADAAAKFWRAFSERSKECSEFALIITKFALKSSAFEAEETSSLVNRFRQKALAGLPQGVLAEKYARNSLVFFLPDYDADGCASFCGNLHKEADEAGLAAVSGVFPYPMLNYRRDECEIGALKALTYGEMLPEPHIGIFDHLALAISADKFFAEGKELEAMAEYRRALLLKPDEPLILNSLAVCMAAMNRNMEASELLNRALECDPDPAMRTKICYNLGNICEKEQNFADARRWYGQCIELERENIYAYLKLAQIMQNTGQLEEARALYRKARVVAADKTELVNIIERGLARLDDAGGQSGVAKERLHDALLRDPEDGETLLLLAQSYLRDEPKIAETLARKSLAYGMDAWAVIAQAREAQNGLPESQAS